jgi:hypothetical protein
MAALSYHAGQIAVQEEAKTRPVADKLAHWVGPVGEFALGADLFLFATADADGILSFTVLSGDPPLVEVGANRSSGSASHSAWRLCRGRRWPAAGSPSVSVRPAERASTGR